MELNIGDKVCWIKGSDKKRIYTITEKFKLDDGCHNEWYYSARDTFGDDPKQLASFPSSEFKLVTK